MEHEVKKPISAEQFIRVWQTSKTVGEVAKRLGYKHNTTPTSRATDMRRKGVPLQRMQVGSVGNDYKALAKLARECANGQS